MNSLREVKRKALAVRDRADFLTHLQVYQRMAASGPVLELGDEWSLAFLPQVPGFKLSNKNYTNVIPDGIPACPVKECPGYFYGFVRCKHAGTEDRLTRNFKSGEFSSAEWLELKAEMSSHFKLPLFPSAGDGQGSVYEKLRTKPYKNNARRVQVSVGKLTSRSFHVEHMVNKLWTWNTCGYKDCDDEGLQLVNADYYCVPHAKMITTPEKNETRRCGLEAFYRIHRSSNGIPQDGIIDKTDQAAFINTLGYIFSRGNAGVSVTIEEVPFIWKLAENDGHLHLKYKRNQTGIRKYNYVCIGTFCFLSTKGKTSGCPQHDSSTTTLFERIRTASAQYNAQIIIY